MFSTTVLKLYSNFHPLDYSVHALFLLYSTTALIHLAVQYNRTLRLPLDDRRANACLPFGLAALPMHSPAPPAAAAVAAAIEAAVATARVTIGPRTVVAATEADGTGGSPWQ